MPQAKRKLRSTHLRQPVIKPEKDLKVCNLSIRLVDIVKNYKKEETNLQLDKIFIVKDAQNQFHIDKKSENKTFINNKEYTNKIDNVEASLESNKNEKTFSNENKEMEYNDKINSFKIYNKNLTKNTSISSSSCEPDSTLDVSERIECSDKANTSSINDISNIIDSSLISFLSEESVYTSLTGTIRESLLNIDQQTLYNVENELIETSLNNSYIDNKVVNNEVDENKVLLMHTNKEKLIAMESELDKENRNTIKNNSIIQAEIKDQIKDNFKNNKVRKDDISNVYCPIDSSNNIKTSFSLSKFDNIDKQLKQIYKAEKVLCNIQKNDMTEGSKKTSYNFQQLDENCFQQLTDITNQNENLIKNGMKNVSDNSFLYSTSKDMHNEKSIAHFDDYDCNNNSEEVVPKCIITENITFNTPYTIVKQTPTEIDKIEDKRGIHKYSARNNYSKFNKNSNKKSISFSNLSSYDNGNNDSLETNITENISEYKPSDESQSLTEINSTEIMANTNNDTNNEISSASENDEYSQFKFNVPGNSACNDFELTAEMSKGPKGNNKKNFCVFCHTLQSKIARHLENKHRDEDQVKDFSNLPKGCAERLHKIASIRKEGNFIFNATKEYNHGRLITVRRPTQKSKQNGTNFVNCPYCNGFYTRNNLRHHVQQCNKNENSNLKSSKRILQDARRALGRYHPEASRRMRVKILPVLQEDEITKAIRYDRAIILYGNNMCKSQIHEHQNNYIRAYLRLLGRLVLALRNRNPDINTLAAAYAPQFYRIVIEAINDVAEFDYKANMYKHPTNAFTLGTCMKKIGKILDVTYMIDNDLVKRKHVEDFMKIYDVDFSGTVNKIVTETQAKIKRQKKIVLPRTSDIKILSNYLKKKMEENSKSLSIEFSYEAWKSLAEVTFIAVQVFNRRRAGETERILINDYKNYQCACGTNTMCKSSKQTDKTHNYVRFIIRGKLNRTVPVLLDTQMLKSIELLLQFRKDAKVSSSNPFLFGLPSINKKHYKHLRACKLMRDFASECGAKNVSALRGTALRKHVATKCVDLNLSDNQVTRVANFMGHHEHIHKEIYRQPVAKVDILEMSKILEKAQGADSTFNEITDVSMNNENNNLSFNNKDISQSSIDINKEFIDEASYNEASTDGASTDGAFIDTSIEAKEKKKIWKGKEQTIKRKKITQNRKKRNTTIKKIQNVQKKNKNKCDEENKQALHPQKKQNTYSKNKGLIYRKHSDSDISDYVINTSSDSSNESIIHANKTRKQKIRSEPYKKKTRWTNKEISDANTYFSNYIRKRKLPPLPEIEKVKMTYNILKDRKPDVIKNMDSQPVQEKLNL